MIATPRRPSILVLLVALGGCAPSGAISPPRPATPVFPGFDVWQYPGDELMTEWRRSSPYQWVGYYLPSPCHRDASYVGKRQFLAGNGWGIAVLYVGQQLFEGQPPTEISETTLCTSQFLTRERGAVDGRDAVERAAAEGFPQNTTIFLDVERVGRIAPELTAYFEGWVESVLRDGRFTPGVYCHLSNAAALYTISQALLGRIPTSRTIPFWISGGTGFTLTTPPERVGYGFAEVWQGVLDEPRSWGGRTLVVDENVASTPSPSDPSRGGPIRLPSSSGSGSGSGSVGIEPR